MKPLGQIDTIFDPGVAVDPTMLDPSMFATDPLLSQGFTQQEADMISAAAANGVISDAQFQSILSGNHSYEEVANMIFGTVTPSGPTIAQAAMPSMTPAQAASAAAAALKAGTTAVTALAPGAAPRVPVRPPGVAASSFLPAALTQATVIPGIPNIALIGGGLLLAMAMGRK
jgi:type V secretory pathway adhesin AidA